MKNFSASFGSLFNTKTIFFVAVLVSILASFVFMSRNLSLTYRDSKSHLNIAKRVYSSKTPGLAQLGGIWLPLPHITMLPTVWEDDMYYSGLSGIIPSMIAFITLCVTIFSAIYFFTKDKIAALIGTFVLFSSPSLLYLQSTPMSESLLLCFSTLSAYFVLRWSQDRDFKNIIWASVFIFFATLTRYDAWFLFIAELGLVFLLPFLSKKEKRREGEAFLFGFMGGFGIFIWMIYNKFIFGSFFNFALGQGSGSYDAARVAGQSGASPLHSVVNSVLTYGWMTIDNVGIVLITMSLISLVIFLSTTKNFPKILAGLLFLSPFIFNVFSLYLGQSIALSKHLAPYITYNLRYGAGMVPVVAFFLGYLASKGKIWKILIIGAIVIQVGLFYGKPLEIINDAEVGQDFGEQKVAAWLRENPVQGNVLMSMLAHDPLLFESRIPMRNVIYEGNQELWQSATKYPEAYVNRLVLKVSDTKNDGVTKSLYNTRTLKENFTKVYDKDGYQVYDNKRIIN